MTRKCLSSPRKVRYPTQAKATAAALQLQVVRGQLLEAYHCSGCHGWHLATARPAHPGAKNRRRHR